MTVSLVDFHCHLDLYADFEESVKSAEQAGVYTLSVTTTPRAWQRNLELTRGTHCIRAALGLHPQLIAEHHEEIKLWESYVHETRYVGEVGLDAGSRYYRSLDLQKQVFQHILRVCAKAGGKILSVHSIRAATQVLDMVESLLPRDRGQIVLHWFTGSPAEARRGIDLGCYFSINTAMLNSKRAIDLVTSIPSERILTETDGPFTQIRGRSARPNDVKVAIDALANLWHSTPEAAAATVQSNLQKLLTAQS